MRWPTFDQHGDGMLMCCIDVAAMPELCCLIRWLTDASRVRRRPRATGVDDRRAGLGEAPSCVDSQNWTGRRRAQFRGGYGSASVVDQIRAITASARKSAHTMRPPWCKCAHVCADR